MSVGGDIVGYIAIAIILFIIFLKMRSSFKKLFEVLGIKKKGEEVESPIKSAIVPDGFRRGQQEWVVK